MLKNSVLLWGVGGALVLALVAASGLLFTKEACRDFSEGKLQVGQATLDVSVAMTPAERTTGLAGCQGLPKNSGMYFPHDPPQNVGFWMKGMVIPLDIVWIANGKVVGVEESVPTIEKTAVNPTIYYPPVAVSGILEVAAGTAKIYGLTVGTPVNFVAN